MGDALKHRKAKDGGFVERRRRARSAPGFGSKRARALVDGLTRGELVKKYDHKVRAEAWRIAKRGPNVIEVDDLVSMGFLGLMDAADKYDPKRGVKFDTYAEYRIRGAMLDELRRQDWVPRSARATAKAIEAAYSTVEGDTRTRATDKEVSRKLGLSLKRFQKIRRDIGSLSLVHYENIESLREQEDSVFTAALENGQADLFTEITRKDAKEMLDRLFTTLEEDERIILSCYYYRGLNQAEIGEILSLSESRVSQLHKRAILKIRKELQSKAPSAQRLFQMLFEV